MAALPFSVALSSSLACLGLPKASLNSSSASWPSMACFAPSFRSSLGSANSSLMQYRFSLQSPGRSGFLSKPRSFVVSARTATEKTIYDYAVKDIDGKDVPLNNFKGKVLLIVNVASRCGLTTSNYTELSHLYEKYKTQGFEILAFPCNQFGGQEPGSNPDIKNFACTRFKAEFPIFDKVDVNGPNTAPVYQFLKSNAGGFLGDLIKWNFEKFLIDKNGKVVERYPPTTSPFQIEANRHTIILMQTSQNRATRTFMDYDSIAQAMGGICALYERKIKDLNPANRNITYDIADLYNFIDGLADMSALVYDHRIQAFLPYDREWIKQKTFQHLRRFAH